MQLTIVICVCYMYVTTHAQCLCCVHTPHIRLYDCFVQLYEYYEIFENHNAYRIIFVGRSRGTFNKTTSIVSHNRLTVSAGEDDCSYHLHGSEVSTP